MHYKGPTAFIVWLKNEANLSTHLHLVLIKVVAEVMLIGSAHLQLHVVLHFQRRMIDPLDIIYVDYCASKDFDKFATQSIHQFFHGYICPY